MPPMVTRIRSRRPIRHFLREWRESRHLTQEQLAERLGTSKENISRWENHKRQMNEAIMAELASALDIDLPDLWRPPDVPSADQLLAGTSADEREHAIDILRTFLRKTGS